MRPARVSDTAADKGDTASSKNIDLNLRVNFDVTTEFPGGKKLRAKLLISRGRLWHENFLIGEFGALSEKVLATSGNIVKTGAASGFQAVSSVTMLPARHRCMEA